MTIPDPLPPSRPLLARMVTTDGSARFATCAAGHAAPLDADAEELPLSESDVSLTISPPATPPITAPATSATTVGTAAAPNRRPPRPLSADPPGSSATLNSLQSRRDVVAPPTG